MHSQYDPETDELFLSYTCMNDDALPKIIYGIYKIEQAGNQVNGT